jgi:hypothetical protein
MISLSLCLLSTGTGISADQEDEIVALLNGEPIYRSEVEQPVAFQIYRLRGNIYTILKRQIEEMVTEKLLQKEAAERGISPDEFIKKKLTKKSYHPARKRSKPTWQIIHPVPLMRKRDETALKSFCIKMRSASAKMNL